MAFEKLEVEEKLRFHRFREPFVCLLRSRTRGVDCGSGGCVVGGGGSCVAGGWCDCCCCVG